MSAEEEMLKAIARTKAARDGVMVWDTREEGRVMLMGEKGDLVKELVESRKGE